MKWKLLCLLLGVLFVQLAQATEPIYVNSDPSYYDVYNSTVSPNPPPTIDATAFDNENTFSVSYQNYSPYPVLFETWNTLNFTNAGGQTMIANSPGVTNGAIIVLDQSSFGSGFHFDLHTTNQLPDQMAGTFYNAGNIRCDSIQDGNNLFNLGLGIDLYLVTSLGQFIASATNVLCPGNIDVGTDGLIQMTSQNMDLSGGTLTIESPLNIVGNLETFGNLGTLDGLNFNSTGAVGTDTNADWNPGLDLGANAAVSSEVPIPPYQLVLTNSQAYLDIKTPATNYTIYRYVFVQNNSPEAPYNVYIDPIDAEFGLAEGAAHVEWVGGYTDPASGNQVTSYLYLTDDYLLGASTNVAVIGGVPDNFTFVTSPTELLFNPTPQGPVNLPIGYITNNYAVMFGTISSSTVNTNANLVNPNGSVTNLPGVIKLSANTTMNLGNATIAGANYLSLNCTNQFLGSPGAFIAPAYADIALGVTNGFLTMSNVLAANIPEWSGTIQAWSTAWLTVDAFGNTNDYRVLLVYSALKPTSSSWIQNLYLHGTNLVISDPLQVYASFFSDAQSLTLNTNQLGVGASSLDGEINWGGLQPFNANSGSGTQQMPNLLYLTNNGAIRVLETANFGNPNSFLNVTPATPAVPATGTLSETGTNVLINDRVTIGTNQYTFVKTLTNATANLVTWATNFDGSLSNLIQAINGVAAGRGVSYSAATLSNSFAAAGMLANHAFTVTALSTNAAIGDAISTLFKPATGASNLTWSGSVTLTNGVNYVPSVSNYSTSVSTAFVNHSLISDQGTKVSASYFENDGTISNGTGGFFLKCGLGVLTNGNLTSSGDVLLSATNSPGIGSNGLTISNQFISAGVSLTLATTNLAGDAVTNGNIWVVGANSGGGAADSGFNTPIKAGGDLLGTTVTNIAPFNKTIYNVWAGTDYGISPLGYSGNMAVGHLVLDSLTTNDSHVGSKVAYVFSGAGASNALYVDCLDLQDAATYGNNTNQYNFPWLQINPNMMIYYAQALENGKSVAEAIDNVSRNGGNGGRLRWVYSYAGYLSSTNVLYTNLDGSVTTNSVNAALAQSSSIDSDSDGIPNSIDPTPFFVPQEIKFTLTVTNNASQPVAKVQWTTIPNATNSIWYTTNLASTNWLALTNFPNWYFGNNVAVTNASHGNSFLSPQVYVHNATLPDNSQQTNVWVYDLVTNVPHFYKVVVWPWLNFPE